MKALDSSRTIRLSTETDRRIEAAAAKKGHTASEEIRETLEREYPEDEATAGAWILSQAARKPDREPDKAFSEAYRRRHS